MPKRADREPGIAPPAETESGERKPFGRPLLIIFVARTALNTAHRIIYPFLPSIARGLGISLGSASLLISLRLVAGLAAPFLGPVADRYGRRRVMVAALLIFVVAAFLLAGGNLFLTAAVAFTLFGLAKVIYDPAVHAYLGDTVPYAKRGKAVGTVELSWSSAWLLGVPLAGVLIQSWGWKAPWAVLGGLGLLSAWLTHVALAPGQRPVAQEAGRFPLSSLLRSWRALLSRRSILILLGTSFLMTMAQELPFIVYGAWLESAFGLGLTTLGVASIVIGVAEGAAELGTTVFTDRWGKRRSVLIGLAGLAASLMVLPSLARLGLAPALIGVALVMVTFEFGIVSLLPMVSELAPEARATLLSWNITAFSLGRIAGAAAGGWLWEWNAEGIALHAVVGAICALAAALLMAMGIREIVDEESDRITPAGEGGPV